MKNRENPISISMPSETGKPTLTLWNLRIEILKKITKLRIVHPR